MSVVHVELLDKLFRRVELGVVVKFKCLPVEFAHILVGRQLIDVTLKGLKLEILPLVVREDGHAVFKLESVTVSGIVNEHHVVEVAVYYPEVFDVYA